eukprot:NODE_806_length_2756_cov_7.563712.p1 GENE.NODE_806_length_2756_cov_7.563712~~NODE_806_length_2756_cov_7.563712.p1  ORF type:complete len:789 (+),score=143.91 NODE_806_length_2756_cov_7.563712:121-2487(+)
MFLIGTSHVLCVSCAANRFGASIGLESRSAEYSHARRRSRGVLAARWPIPLATNTRRLSLAQQLCVLCYLLVIMPACGTAFDVPKAGSAAAAEHLARKGRRQQADGGNPSAGSGQPFTPLATVASIAVAANVKSATAVGGDLPAATRTASDSREGHAAANVAPAPSAATIASRVADMTSALLLEGEPAATERRMPSHLPFPDAARGAAAEAVGAEVGEEVAFGRRTMSTPTSGLYGSRLAFQLPSDVPSVERMSGAAHKWMDAGLEAVAQVPLTSAVIKYFKETRPWMAQLVKVASSAQDTLAMLPMRYDAVFATFAPLKPVFAETNGFVMLVKSRSKMQALTNTVDLLANTSGVLAQVNNALLGIAKLGRDLQDFLRQLLQEIQPSRQVPLPSSGHRRLLIERRLRKLRNLRRLVPFTAVFRGLDDAFLNLVANFTDLANTVSGCLHDDVLKQLALRLQELTPAATAPRNRTSSSYSLFGQVAGKVRSNPGKIAKATKEVIPAWRRCEVVGMTMCSKAADLMTALTSLKCRVSGMVDSGVERANGVERIAYTCLQTSAHAQARCPLKQQSLSINDQLSKYAADVAWGPKRPPKQRGFFDMLGPSTDNSDTTDTSDRLDSSDSSDSSDNSASSDNSNSSDSSDLGDGRHGSAKKTPSGPSSRLGAPQRGSASSSRSNVSDTMDNATHAKDAYKGNFSSEPPQTAMAAAAASAAAAAASAASVATAAVSPAWIATGLPASPKKWNRRTIYGMSIGGGGVMLCFLLCLWLLCYWLCVNCSDGDSDDSESE